ncbi:hypothetical protein Poli38472_008478 [Pythium oligandrum]|uniref:HMG box domain-containing protein n=1 Tax=Pythium oligandrum TaxID=41045 RepID=A0A8K1FA27_PYTOL|nr:hypothetical protein Poli38472_008478 [Pythium oligandrum]|eukprot:TMW55830.1 hypothetical protein Poli38472_008478 [Pythium oligandrum]
MAPPKKPQSAYFLFAADKRKTVAQENPGLRIGEIQKLITAQWKELSAEEKEHYTTLAVQDKERYEREKLENPVELPEANAQDGVEDEPTGNVCIYPLGRVKRIIQSDPDVNKVSREALIAISKASELFAQYLATKSYEQTLYNNKRQIKASDVARAIQTTSVLDWLREDFPDVKPAAATRSNGSKSTSDTATSRKAKATKAGVSSFFQQTANDTADEPMESATETEGH